ncbi:MULTISPECIES: methylated-DNA--[protein]-cysteine S-methyltransferase [Nocardiopsis]|uniref:Methylated-DNA--protein-cysteine methyltransferase n=1 Tax=Nocardiopsis sinuspersici TaxID=501010 RepID=A0A1V3C7T9_9ACTN|nr:MULTISPECIES: methylated-DNA--[protein]-cysteine S-methyltransferase [Nocardiopsis]NYH53506.1 methylated-DNA-[protein]-cysteine S-methyltransferase [Nocardiopsis sinuspersici]OOC56825.1 cysteine methyltransferase [Nocardiopsis sinuspersici]
MSTEQGVEQEMLPLDVEPKAPPRRATVEFRAPRPGPTRYTMMGSPVGELVLFGDGEALGGVLTAGKDDRTRGFPKDWVSDPEPFTEAVRQLEAYFAGELREFDLPLAPAGTEWQLRVWAALTTIPHGETASYGELAAELGRPTASRAVGMANGRNPISIIVPCHRVIGADGSLTGYAGGLDRKQFLLGLERRVSDAR